MGVKDGLATGSKNYDPRAKLMQETTKEVLAAVAGNDSLLKLAVALEKIALKTIREPQAHPNVDFYRDRAGPWASPHPCLPAFSRWPARWAGSRNGNEMIPSGAEDRRRRQLYTAPKRDVVPTRSAVARFERKRDVECDEGFPTPPTCSGRTPRSWRTSRAVPAGPCPAGRPARPVRPVAGQRQQGRRARTGDRRRRARAPPPRPQRLPPATAGPEGPQYIRAHRVMAWHNLALDR